MQIGNAVVDLKNAARLPDTLQGLRRLPSDATNVLATLEISWQDDVTWPIGVMAEGGLHRFGRTTYAMEVAPVERLILLVFTAQPDGDEIYWLQRDIFGILACLSGEVMLHASALISPDGGAWVFCGQSGVGKSTLAWSLAMTGREIVNDEVNWLYEKAGEGWFLVNQGFWFGGGASPELPLRRLCLLEQAGVCEVRPAPPKSEVFARLIAAHLSIDSDYGYLEARANALKEFVMNYEVEVLAFNLDTHALLKLL